MGNESPSQSAFENIEKQHWQNGVELTPFQWNYFCSLTEAVSSSILWLYSTDLSTPLKWVPLFSHFLTRYDSYSSTIHLIRLWFIFLKHLKPEAETESHLRRNWMIEMEPHWFDNSGDVTAAFSFMESAHASLQVIHNSANVNTERLTHGWLQCTWPILFE